MHALTTVITRSSRRLGGGRLAAMLAAFVLAVAVPAAIGTTANAAIVASVPLGTAAQYAVLAGTTVTNTGPSILNGSLGVFPGSAVVGFPPGVVNPPGTIQAATAAAGIAKGNLTNAYNNAAGRPLNATVPGALSGLTLVGGVYAAAGNGPLSLTGTVTLDGANDPSSVFIFKTGSTLITGSGSQVALINGAQACNVFWQVGSSATLGVSSTFRGNILALTSISVLTGTTVHGRALARNGAVTLDTNVFHRPGCDLTTTTAAPTTSAPSTTVAPTTTVAGPTTTVAGPTTTVAGPTTTLAGPTTTLAGPTTTLAGPTTTMAGPSTTLAAAPPSTLAAAPTTTAAAPTTTLAAPNNPLAVAPDTTVATSTTTKAATASVPVPAQPSPATTIATARVAGPTPAPSAAAPSTPAIGRTAAPVSELPRTGPGLLLGSLLVGGAALLAGIALLRVRDRMASR